MLAHNQEVAERIEEEKRVAEERRRVRVLEKARDYKRRRRLGLVVPKGRGGGGADDTSLTGLRCHIIA